MHREAMPSEQLAKGKNEGDVSSMVGIPLANSEASKFLLAFHFFEGTEAWKKLGGNLGCTAEK